MRIDSAIYICSNDLDLYNPSESISGETVVAEGEITIDTLEEFKGLFHRFSDYADKQAFVEAGYDGVTYRANVQDLLEEYWGQPHNSLKSFIGLVKGIFDRESAAFKIHYLVEGRNTPVCAVVKASSGGEAANFIRKTLFECGIASSQESLSSLELSWCGLGDKLVNIKREAGVPFYE